MMKTCMECLGQVMAVVLFFVVVWIVLGVDGALSGDTDLCTESFKSALRAVFGR